MQELYYDTAFAASSSASRKLCCCRPSGGTSGPAGGSLLTARARWCGGHPSGGNSMTSSRNKLCVLAMSLGVAWLATGLPAYAESAKGEAKEECKQLLQDKGYKGVDVDSAKRTG